MMDPKDSDEFFLSINQQEPVFSASQQEHDSKNCHSQLNETRDLDEMLHCSQSQTNPLKLRMRTSTLQGGMGVRGVKDFRDDLVTSTLQGGMGVKGVKDFRDDLVDDSDQSEAQSYQESGDAANDENKVTEDGDEDSHYALRTLQDEVDEVMEIGFGEKLNDYRKNAGYIQLALLNWKKNPGKFGALIAKIESHLDKLKPEHRDDESLNLFIALVFLPIEDRILTFKLLWLNYHTNAAGSAIWVYLKKAGELLKLMEKEYKAGLNGFWSFSDEQHKSIGELYQGAAVRDDIDADVEEEDGNVGRSRKRVDPLYDFEVMLLIQIAEGRVGFLSASNSEYFDVERQYANCPNALLLVQRMSAAGNAILLNSASRAGALGRMMLMNVADVSDIVENISGHGAVVNFKKHEKDKGRHVDRSSMTVLHKDSIGMVHEFESTLLEYKKCLMSYGAMNMDPLFPSLRKEAGATSSRNQISIGSEEYNPLSPRDEKTGRIPGMGRPKLNKIVLAPVPTLMKYGFILRKNLDGSDRRLTTGSYRKVFSGLESRYMDPPVDVGRQLGHLRREGGGS